MFKKNLNPKMIKLLIVILSFLISTIFSLPIFSAEVKVVVTKVSDDLWEVKNPSGVLDNYQSAPFYITTKDCFQAAEGDVATLNLVNGMGVITFSWGTSCQVTRTLKYWFNNR